MVAPPLKASPQSIAMFLPPAGMARTGGAHGMAQLPETVVPARAGAQASQVGSAQVSVAWTVAGNLQKGLASCLAHGSIVIDDRPLKSVSGGACRGAEVA